MNRNWACQLSGSGRIQMFKKMMALEGAYECPIVRAVLKHGIMEDIG